MPPQGPPAVTFADESNLDSDNEDERTSGLASSSSTSKSPGVTLGFDDGPMPPSSSSSLEANGDGQQDDQLNVEVSRIGGRLAVRSSSFREPVPSERSCMACEVQEDLFQDEEVFPLEERDLPPVDLLQCPECRATMVLLLQMYAPIEKPLRQLRNSDELRQGNLPRNDYRDECDRILYVFACVVRGCKGVRCLRAGARHPDFAKAGRESRKRKRLELEEKQKQRDINPFSSESSPSFQAGQSNPFALAQESNPFSATSSFSSGNGFGESLFLSGDDGNDEAKFPVSSEAASSSGDVTESGNQDPDPRSSSSFSAGISRSIWPKLASQDKQVHIEPRYLATAIETLGTKRANSNRIARLAQQFSASHFDEDDGEPASPHKGGRVSKSSKSSSSSAAAAAGGASSTSGGDNGWSSEAYEVMRVAGVEEVFLAFQERLESSNAADQVIRHEYGGVPLPYSAKSKPFTLLYDPKLPAAPGSSIAITRTVYSNNDGQQHRSGRGGTYDTSCRAVPRCQFCQSPRTFELEIMPHFVSAAERSLNGAMSDQGGQGESESEKGQAQDALELGWATVWCFVCSADCMDGDETLDVDGEGLDWRGWREEVAWVELED